MKTPHTSNSKQKFKANRTIQSFNRPPRKTIQGLWAELFIIERANNPEYLIQSWHSSSEDKFDFNDGQDKIEVKAQQMSVVFIDFPLNNLIQIRTLILLIVSVL